MSRALVEAERRWTALTAPPAPQRRTPSVRRPERVDLRRWVLSQFTPAARRLAG